MIVVSNSSPLITLARIKQLHLLREMFGRIHVASEVFQEVVIQGAGRPGAEAVGGAGWIDKHASSSSPPPVLLNPHASLGAGEIATVLLAGSLGADLALIDERAARRLARAQGIAVMGCVGILEIAFQRGLVTDLRGHYLHLLSEGIRVDRRLLNKSLALFNLPPL